MKHISYGTHNVTIQRAKDILSDWVMRAQEYDECSDDREDELILERIWELLEERFTDKDFSDI